MGLSRREGATDLQRTVGRRLSALRSMPIDPTHLSTSTRVLRFSKNAWHYLARSTHKHLPQPAPSLAGRRKFNSFIRLWSRPPPAPSVATPLTPVAHTTGRTHPDRTPKRSPSPPWIHPAPCSDALIPCAMR